MSKTKTYKNDVRAVIHEIARGLHGVGMIDKQTVRRFGDSCLTPIQENHLREGGVTPIASAK